MDEKMRLAELFYKGSLQEKTFGGLRSEIEKKKNIEELFEGEVINNCIETLKYSLIKLKNESV